MNPMSTICRAFVFVFFCVFIFRQCSISSVLPQFCRFSFYCGMLPSMEKYNIVKVTLLLPTYFPFNIARTELCRIVWAGHENHFQRSFQFSFVCVCINIQCIEAIIMSMNAYLILGTERMYSYGFSQYNNFSVASRAQF